MPKTYASKKTSMAKLISEWKYLCSIEKDAHTAISGDEGDGKSHLLSGIIKAMKGNLWDNVVYTGNPQEYYDKYENLPAENFVMGFDEALDLMNRIDWAKTDVKDLVKHIRGKVRKEKRGVFLYNVQLFRDLHGYWRTHRIRYLLELTPREWFSEKGINYVYVMKRYRVPFLTGKRDTWLLDVAEKEWLDAMRKGIVRGPSYINMIRRHPFYMGEFKFSGLESAVSREYLKRREEAYAEYRIEPDIGPRASRAIEQRNALIARYKELGVSKKQIIEDTMLTSRQIDRIVANESKDV